jgi:hypothetical protein
LRVFTELHVATGAKFELRDQDQGGLFVPLGRDQPEDDTVNVSSVNGGGHCEFAYMAEGTPLRVRDRRSEKGRNACPLVRMLCHNELRAWLKKLTL